MTLEIKAEIWNRVSGYFRPVNQWNKGKQEEERERVKYKIPEGLNDKNNIMVSGTDSKHAVVD